MLSPERLYGETRTFSSESVKYGFPLDAARSLSIEALRENIVSRVGSLTGDDVLGISFAGFPGVGKTSQLRHMVSTSTKALGGGKPPLLTYVHPESGIETPAGRSARDGMVGVIHGDHMFRAIGPDRRGVMLSGKENFSHLWADDERLARIFWSIVEGRSPKDPIYMGSRMEKTQRRPLGQIKLLRTSVKDGKKVMILEGVQAVESLPTIAGLHSKYRLQTMKILFDVSLVDSMIRLLRREHDEKKHPDGTPYSFREILEHRLLEQYYILETFIGPATLEKDILLLEKPREMPPFRTHERDEILGFLDSYRLSSMHANDVDLSRFVYGLIARLQDYFLEHPGVDEGAYISWKQARTEKKKRQAIEALS